MNDEYLMIVRVSSGTSTSCNQIISFYVPKKNCDALLSEHNCENGRTDSTQTEIQFLWRLILDFSRQQVT